MEKEGVQLVSVTNHFIFMVPDGKQSATDALNDACADNGRNYLRKIKTTKKTINTMKSIKQMASILLVAASMMLVFTPTCWRKQNGRMFKAATSRVATATPMQE